MVERVGGGAGRRRRGRQPDDAPGPALGQAERLFPGLAADSIESFTVTRGATNIVAQRTSGQWRVADGLPRPPWRLQRLAKLLSELTVSQRIAEANWTETGNETTFGLNAETRAIVRWKSAGKEQSLEVGAPALFGRQTYVRLPGSRDAILVDSDLANWVPRNADDWRDLRLVPENLDFDSLRFWGQSRTIQLNRDGNGTWRMKEPIDTGTDQSVILQLIKRMQLARIVQIAPDDAATATEPDATVRLAKDDETLIQLAFRKPDDDEDSNIWVTHSNRGARGDTGRRPVDPAPAASQSVPQPRHIPEATGRGHLRHRRYGQQIHREPAGGRFVAGQRTADIPGRHAVGQHHAGHHPQRSGDRLREGQRHCDRFQKGGFGQPVDEPENRRSLFDNRLVE